MAEESKRLSIVLTDQADATMREIWDWNQVEYGADHADAYCNFLYGELALLADHPRIGQTLADFPNLRHITMRKRPSGHGPVAIYRVRGALVEVLYIFHTAMNWPQLVREPG